MDPQYIPETSKHLEKQHELLWEAYRSMTHELQKLQVEEEMLMRKFYEAMSAQNSNKKGAWQPSLNISTVLTSILLLLTEPNPDDGLMYEASKEYKYNRQAFDHKARSMREKYAIDESIENGSIPLSVKLDLNLK